MTDLIWGLAGMLVLMLMAWASSSNRSAINWKTVLGALGIQLFFAFVVLFWGPGRSALGAVSSGVQGVINNAFEGISFLFGGLVGPEAAAGFVFALNVLPVIIFFSSLIAVLYHVGIMQIVIRFIGGGLSKLLGTSRTESMSATANIFVGQTEAPLVVRPYLNSMTRSEIFAVMVGGLASVAGSTLAGYAGLGIRLDYLIAASFMAAPAGLLMAKMIFPETEQMLTPSITSPEPEPESEELILPLGTPIEDKTAAQRQEFADTIQDTNVIDAAARGASEGLSLALNVGAMLLAFIGLIALLNGILGGIGGLFGFEGLTIQLLLGYVFAPFAIVMGVDPFEAVKAGGFLGQKLVTNEFVAFVEFAQTLKEGGISPKMEAIITFALCGFANFSSLGILLGGLGSMAPDRRPDIAQLGVKAIGAAVLANMMSGTIAGMLVAMSQ